VPYQFLVDTYETESIKVVSVWSEFRDEELEVRPRGGDPRGRSVRHRVYSNYGPTAADTGELMQDHAPTIYAYPTLDALFNGEAGGGAKAVLPEASGKPLTERPAAPMAGRQRL
jgi:hypothetical protein